MDIKKAQELINEQKRMRVLLEAFKHQDGHPRIHPDIERALRTRKHPLGNNPAYPHSDEDAHYEEKVASKRYEDVVNRVKRYHGDDNINPMQMMMEMMPQVMEIMQLEKPHIRRLEELAVEVIKEEFGLTDEIEFDVEITKNVAMEGVQDEEGDDEMEFESHEEIEAADAEVKKRRFLNAIINGAAKKGHFLFHMIDDQLSALNPRLMNLYGKVMSTNDFLLWLHPDMAAGGGRGGSQEGGAVRIDMSGEKPKVIAKAFIFPVLLHELVKGVMEVVSNHGLPKDPKLAKHVMSKADFNRGEVWDWRLGPGLWERFVDAIDANEHDVRYHLYHEIVQMPTAEFNSFMKELLAGTKKGKQALVDLANKIKREMKEDDYDAAMNPDDPDTNIDDIDITDLFK